MLAEVFTELIRSQWISAFLVILARLSFVIMLMPGIGEQVVPAQFRVLLLLGLSVSILTSLPQLPEIPERNTDFLVLLFREVTIGLSIGISMRLGIWVLAMTGALIAQAMGLSQFLGVAIDNEAQPILSNMLSMAGATLFLSANLHVEVLVNLIRLYTEIPVSQSFEFDRDELMRNIFRAFGFAVLLCWPFAVANVVYNVCLGFINKAMPQLMVAFVGAPFMVGAGLILLTGAIGAILAAWMGQIQQFLMIL